MVTFGDKEKKIVALCSSRIYEPQIHSFIVRLNEELKKRDISLWIYSLNTDLYWEEERIPAEVFVFDVIPFELIDILVVMDEKIKSHTVAGRMVGRAHKAGKPVIVLDGNYEGCGSIRFDFAGGFEKVVRHVFEEHKVRRPHFMAGIEGNPFSEERLEIFKRLAVEAGYGFSDDMVSYGEFWAIPAREATEKLLKRDELPDAIICANDIMAINVCDVLKHAGIDVPGRVIVTGFDGYFEAMVSQPAITTVNCELDEMSEKTAAMIFDCLDGREPSEELVIPTLIKNESCGCPRCTDINSSVMGRFNSSFYRFQDDLHEMHEAITGMVMSNALTGGFEFLRTKYTNEASCIINAACFENDRNYFQDLRFDERYVVGYDADEKIRAGEPIDRRAVMPHLLERMDCGYPLLFQALHFMNKPVGYMVFFFETYEITDYAKMGSVAEMVGMGLGCYMIMQHQQYLNARVEELYRFDALTGLYNRLAFQTAFEAMISDPAYEGRKLLVIMADLNGLKKINDTMGHEAGDEAIAAVAACLREELPEDSLLARFGGDEMIAFIPDGDESLKQKIEKGLEQKSAEAGFGISASLGTCLSRIHRDINLEEVIRNADEDMYEMKKRHYEERK